MNNKLFFFAVLLIVATINDVSTADAMTSIAMTIHSKRSRQFLIRRSVRYLLVSHGFRLLQTVVVLAALSFVLTGSRIARIDQIWQSADIVASILSLSRQ